VPTRFGIPVGTRVGRVGAVTIRCG
jgi:hypothetical protein